MDKKSKGAKIMYVGDGINDALAMTVSDVSVAVANASGVARISASILLFNKNLKAIPWIIKFSNQVKKSFIQILYGQVCTTPLVLLWRWLVSYNPYGQQCL